MFIGRAPYFDYFLAKNAAMYRRKSFNLNLPMRSPKDGGGKGCDNPTPPASYALITEAQKLAFGVDMCNSKSKVETSNFLKSKLQTLRSKLSKNKVII